MELYCTVLGSSGAGGMNGLGFCVETLMELTF